MIKHDHIEVFRVSRSAMAETWRYLSDRGARELEGVVYWTGEATPNQGTVRHVLVPRRYQRESAVHLVIDRDAVFELIERIHMLDEFLLARVHSHPDEAFHSWSDDEGCLSGRVGFLSIVVPDFARGPPRTDVWAVYERAPGGDWRRLTDAEVQRRLRIG
jgi:hypothetical protein